MSQVKKLKEQVQELKEELRLRDEERSSQCENKPIVIPQIRKVPKFSGSTKTDAFISVEDWIDEVEYVMNSRYMSRAEQVDFIYSNLTGNAKEEIKYRRYVERQSPETILRILRETFGERDGITILQRNFYERKQHEGENLREYSYALMDLMKKVLKKDSGVVANPELTLCEQFAQNVLDSSLRKELKRLVRQNPHYEFFEFRDEAIAYWEDEERYSYGACARKSSEAEVKPEVSDNRTVPKETGSETGEKEPDIRLSGYLDVIKKQEQHIESLTKLLERQSVTPRQPNYGFGPKRDGYDRKRTCFNCGSENHLIRNCPYESRQDGGYEGQYQNRRPYNRDDRGQYQDRGNQGPYNRGDKGQYQNQNAGK